MSSIVIRHAEQRDAEALRQLNGQPEVYRETLQLPYPSMEHWQNRLQEKQPGLYNLVATIDDIVLGHLALEVGTRPRRNFVATFGISVAHQAQRCGIGSALMGEMISMCDKWLRIERIELAVYSDNPAVNLYRKFGFEEEGIGKRYAYRDGEYVDALFMARLKK